MTESVDAIGVEQLAHLSQVSVLVLTSNGGVQSFSDALGVGLESASTLIVVDVVRLTGIQAELADQLVAASRILRASGRRLIVVNAPAKSVSALRAAGVEVSATTDQVFV